MELYLKSHWQLRPQKTIWKDAFINLRKVALRLPILSGKTTTVNEQTSDRIAQRAAELFDQYGNNIYRLAYSYLHRQEEAEDIQIGRAHV